MLLQVYHATFYSYLSYGCAVWGVTSGKNILKIETIHKKSLRIMTFSDSHSHTHPLFINLNLIKVRDIISIEQLKVVYQSFDGSLPDDLQSLFEFRSNMKSTSMDLRSGSLNLLEIP